MVSLVFFYILQLPHTVISNSEKLTHPNAQGKVEFFNFVIEYLSKIVTEFENTLDCLSGAQIGLNHKKWRQKILWHTPLKHFLIFNVNFQKYKCKNTFRSETMFCHEIGHDGCKKIHIILRWLYECNFFCDKMPPKHLATVWLLYVHCCSNVDLHF